MFNYRTKSTTNGVANNPTRDTNGRAANLALSIGSMLRERREAMGASLAEVEAATRIRQKYLAALESDEWNLLPGEVIGRGFLRNYSTYLGLEPNELVERRRAVIDPNLVTVLANTSAGTRLPAERPIDYRPRELDLRDEEEQLEEEQIRVGPYFRRLLLLALVGLIGWGAYQYGQAAGQQASELYSSLSKRVVALLPPLTAPTSTPEPTPLPTATSAPTATSVPPPAAEAPLADPPTAVPPPPTEAPTAAPTATPEPTATSAPQLAALTTNANFRSGPGTDFDIVSAGQVGQQIAIIGRSADAQWFLLDNNSWVFGQLVANPPQNVPVNDGNNPAPTSAPAANESVLPTPTGQAPAAEPPAQTAPLANAISPPACPDANAVIATPGVSQQLSGIVNITGTANREPFDYYKIEMGGIFVGPIKASVVNGTLGAVDTTALPNGPAVLILTAVDLTGNYSACSVSVTIQN